MGLEPKLSHCKALCCAAPQLVKENTSHQFNKHRKTVIIVSLNKRSLSLWEGALMMGV